MDTNPFANLHSYGEYANAYRAANQTAAAQDLDMANKSNIYATQVLSAATGTGNQDIYNTALQHLNDRGIDITGWAPDVQTAAQQTQAARLAQSPIGALFNAGSKMDANANSVALAGGVLPAGGGNGIVNNLLKTGALTGGVPVTLPSAQATSSPNGSFQTALANPTLDPNAAPVAPAAVKPNPAQLAAANTTDAMFGGASQTPTVATPAASFQPPPKDPNETMAAYNARVNQAFEQYKADPAYTAKVAAATDQAKEGVKLKTGAEASQEIFDKLNQNLDALSALNPKVPTQGLILSPEAQGRISAGFATDGLGSGQDADAISQWDQINHQQILNGLQQLVQSGAIRSNKTIAEMLKTGAGIPASGGTVAGRQTMIDNLRAELKNAATAAQNQSAVVNGGATQDYQSLPQSNVTSAPKLGATVSSPTGKYIYKGGDPSQKSSWGKVQ